MLYTFCLFWCFGVMGHAEGALNYDAALDRAQLKAKSEKKMILLNFSTEWCAPCKHFYRDQAENAQIKKLLERTILVSIDAEKGDGPQLAKDYAISVYPTFLLLDANLELHGRWSGYEREPFQKTLVNYLDHPLQASEREERFQKQPQLSDALILASHYESKLNPKALDYLNFAITSDPTNAHIYVMRSFGMHAGLFFRGSKTWDELAATARVVFQTPDMPFMHKARVLSVFSHVRQAPFAPKTGLDDVKDLFVALRNEDREKLTGEEQKEAVWHDATYQVYFEDTPEKALADLKIGLGDNWHEDQDRVDRFGRWCLVNKIGLTEAAQIAESGLDKVEAGMKRVSRLSLLGELALKAGDSGKARAYYENALEESPQNIYIQQKLKTLDSD